MLPVVLLVAYGILLAGSSPDLLDAIGSDPIGALTTILPTWFLLPFAIVAVGGLISGAMMDIYSSGLTLLTLGLVEVLFSLVVSRRVLHEHLTRRELTGIALIVAGVVVITLA